MNVCVFRADASLQIGSGHVMRCLTLADTLREHGMRCHFLSREHSGDLLELVHERGHGLGVLPADDDDADAGSRDENLPAHAAWLGSGWQRDAERSAAAMPEARAAWLVVDHYALDARWERAMAAHCARLMVIDDLADRAHACDLLLDQTHGRNPLNYAALVPAECEVLAGSSYALLRRGFAAHREASLRRRRLPRLRQVLVSMGGVDRDDATGRVLDALAGSVLPADCRITVMMGPAAPWLDAVRHRALRLPWPTEVLVGVDDVPALMAAADLAIGSAGTTAWERCCLGLPSLMVVLADNQRKVAAGLHSAGAAELVGDIDDIGSRLAPLIESLLARPQQLATMGAKASALVDGRGVDAVVARMQR